MGQLEGLWKNRTRRCGRRGGGGGRIRQLPDPAQSRWEKTDEQITPRENPSDRTIPECVPTSVTLRSYIPCFGKMKTMGSYNRCQV